MKQMGPTGLDAGEGRGVAVAEPLGRQWADGGAGQGGGWWRRVFRAAVVACLRTDALPRVRLTRVDWGYLITVFLLTRLLALFIAALGVTMFPAFGGKGFAAMPHGVDGVNGLLQLSVKFDSGWYLGISHQYLTPTSGVASWLAEWAFFPMYPWVLHVVSLGLGLVPGLAAATDSDILAGVLVSHGATFAGLTLLYRLVAGELSTAAARRATLYVLIFPASFFLSAVYPEGLFLLLTVAAFYCARRRQWAVAGVLTAAALLTRAQGALLLGPLGLEFLAYRAQQARPVSRGALKGLWLVLPSMLALVGYALYSHAQTGYWFAFEASEAMAWGHRLTPPVYPLLRFLLAPSLGSASSYDFTSVNFLVAVVFGVLIVVAWRRLPPVYACWLALCLLLPLSANGHYLFSLTRYVAPAFPAFVALAGWSLGLRWSPRPRAGRLGDAGGPALRDGETVAGGPLSEPLSEPLSAATLDLRDRLVVVPSLLLLTLFILLFVTGARAGI